MNRSSDQTKTPLDGLMSRRRLLQATALAPLAAGTVARASGLVEVVRSPKPKNNPALEPTAGNWQTWLVPSVVGIMPAAPPKSGSARTKAELLELQALQSQRNGATNTVVQFWDAQGGVPIWSQILLAKIVENKVNPVLAARAMALLHTAIADATVATWAAKFHYRRQQPSRLTRRITTTSGVNPQLPSYPSEHAAVGAAASAVLEYLFPAQTINLHGETLTFDAAANESAASRLWAGANYRSDLDAGQLLGQAIGLMAVERGSVDGFAAVWDSVNQPGRPTGPQYWVPTPTKFAFPPLLPLAGFCNPWLLESGDQFRPAPPPALLGTFPSAQFLQETAEVKSTVDNLTPDQRTIALFWADDPGTVTPPGHWLSFAIERVQQDALTTPRAARALALTSVGLADAATACWDSKYAYWTVRPVTVIRSMSGQPFYNPTWLPVIETPGFPSYVSGHSTFSGTAATVLQYLFPNHRVTDALGNLVSYQDAAAQAALSRLYAGIHYRSDNEQGLTLGQNVASLVIQRANRDGAG